MKLSYCLALLGSALLLTACFKDEAPPAAASAVQAQPTAPVAALPDAGKLSTEKTTATGVGPTAAAAVDEAIKMAIKQVNGVAVDMSSEQFKSTLALAIGKDAAQLQATAFSEYVAQQSGGVVSRFKVIKLDAPVAAGGMYTANIEADITKFNAPAAESKKLKIVVGEIRVDTDSFKVAGVAVPSTAVAEAIRQRILDALTNTGRFSVLDRELGADIEQEMDMIASGQAPSAERSKMSQAISADLVWTGKIDAFNYQNNQGTWALSQRVINVATRQVQLSNILQGDFNQKLDLSQAKQNLETQMVARVVSAILVRTFPITVASRDGNNVVLSQGGQSVQVGARYQLVSMGQEIKDPQTGQSLGRTEYDCCEVIIDKVGPTMSQGRLENIRMPLEQIQPGGLQLRELTSKTPAASASSASSVKTATTKKTTGTQKAPKDVFADDKDKW
ncbi:CsgG/HfaB family protein [uncultured Deefgea sp.]|uniref:CsgG/HfaB family protein n=1 Tax=uncultured Deefgea sp. TaxID=1304914 RepID=UPI00261C296E|nr:CsgG/HfaB family protein [uncultured Deefgea sp.]